MASCKLFLGFILICVVIQKSLTNPIDSTCGFPLHLESYASNFPDCITAESTNLKNNCASLNNVTELICNSNLKKFDELPKIYDEHMCEWFTKVPDANKLIPPKLKTKIGCDDFCNDTAFKFWICANILVGVKKLEEKRDVSVAKNNGKDNPQQQTTTETKEQSPKKIEIITEETTQSQTKLVTSLLSAQNEDTAKESENTQKTPATTTINNNKPNATENDKPSKSSKNPSDFKEGIKFPAVGNILFGKTTLSYPTTKDIIADTTTTSSTAKVAETTTTATATTETTTVVTTATSPNSKTIVEPTTKTATTVGSTSTTTEGTDEETVKDYVTGKKIGEKESNTKFDANEDLQPGEDSDEEPRQTEESETNNDIYSNNDFNGQQQHKKPQDSPSDSQGNVLPGADFPQYTDSHFFVYFLTAVVLCVLLYLAFHNKQKIIALIIEGRHERRRRSTNVSYKKLDNNLDQVLHGTKGSVTPAHIIY